MSESGSPKAGSGFFERDTVFPVVRGGLLVIPLEREPHNRILSVTLPDLRERGLRRGCSAPGALRGFFGGQAVHADASRATQQAMTMLGSHG